MTGNITNVAVTLTNLSHTFVADIDVLLVSPTGAKFIVVSDAGGGGPGVTGVTYTFNDSAAAIMPTTPQASGTFRPTNYTTGDTFAAPAPAAPYLSPATAGTDTFATAFAGAAPNGTWSLYVVDDAGGDLGSIAGGWTISITTNSACGTPTATPTATPVSTATPTATPTPGLTSVHFTNTTFTEDESQTLTTNLVRTGVTTGSSTVTFATSSGTAIGGAACTAGIDFISVNQTVVFAPGVTSMPVSVVICGDGLNEVTFELATMTITGPDAGPPSSATLRVNDTANAYRNPTPIGIEIRPAGASQSDVPDTTPYPSTITVTNGPSQIGAVRVTFYDMWHVFPDNMDALLVGPGGQKFVLMGDAGGGNAIDPLTPVTITFQDVATAVLPDSAPLTTGKFEPTTWESPVTSFPAPAPPAPYNEPGSAIGGSGTQTLTGTYGLTNANGVWSLYVRDDAGQLVAITGEIGGGWGLEFFAPTAAQASISGRVLTAEGLGIRNAEMVLTGNSLSEPLRVTTSSFGYFQFEGLQTGETYILTVNSRRYTFQAPSQVISLVDNAVDIDFTADPVAP
jgi:subtilisin-like proprotein convertase family protein